jgi:aspartyl-tRNA(Asn)/glutamyl-tRNA(Gln) amidotransferase subunit A
LEDIRAEMSRTLVDSLGQAKNLGVQDFITIQKARAELNDTLADFFTEFDLLVTPTMPTEAFAAKGPPPAEIHGHPVNLLDAVAFTFPFNLSGHPAATVRAGLSANGLPAGLQIIGPRYRDDLVLQAAWAYEQMRPWDDAWPKL